MIRKAKLPRNERTGNDVGQTVGTNGWNEGGTRAADELMKEVQPRSITKEMRIGLKNEDARGLGQGTVRHRFGV